jgi:hypothetical protein
MNLNLAEIVQHFICIVVASDVSISDLGLTGTFPHKNDVVRLCLSSGSDSLSLPRYAMKPNDFVKVTSDMGKKVLGATISDLSKSDRKQRRSGVIVYTRTRENSLLFLAGMDTNTSEITDFGGQREPSDIDAISTGLRELVEESLGVFGKIEPSEVEGCYTIYSSQMMIMFIYMDLDIVQVNRTFDVLRIKKMQALNTTPFSVLEVKRLVIMSFEELKKSICDSDSKMYAVVRDFMRRYIAGLMINTDSKPDFEGAFNLFRRTLLEV